MEINPVDLKKIEDRGSNIYEAVIVSAAKARAINDQNRLEFNERLSAMAPGIEDDFEDQANPDQLKISLEFEKRSKPHLQGLNGFINGDINYKYKDENEK
ncbi:MAG: DNA-directed RNA polymerase subunit omega [Melioribacteraceae bacterium]|nr:DNA-directed RNA polymerase subunit omega [Ignavibacteriota bacterium]MBZ0181066.1 DNA-directed RNA polymerase subunit omega [Melioribacteraceae bacterium]|tara:strand:- start:175 stop:474 length:300 start_codon:yes stop_codon:yes gene_type:complete